MKNTLLLIAAAALFTACGSSDTPHRPGDLSPRGGSATIRKPLPDPLVDDPSTSDDESNDQPVGYFGNVTLEADGTSGTYTLDADTIDTPGGPELRRLYFPKGGWVDFYDCPLDEVYSGECSDENGNRWELRGPG